MNRRTYLLYAIHVSISLSLSGQSFNRDSLTSLIDNSREDTSKVNRLIELSSNLYRQSPSEAIQYGLEAKELGEQLGFTRGIAYALKNMGMGYYFLGKYPEAIDSWQQSLTMFEAENDKLGAANMLNNIGAVYNNIGNDAKALDLYLKSLEASLEINDSLRILTAMINIGLIYLKKPITYDKALEYYKEALPLSEKLGDLDAIGTASVNLGEIYFKKADFDTALMYFEKSLQAFEQTKSGNVSFALTSIGKVYAKRGDFQKAVDYQNRALDIARNLNAKADIVLSLLGLAETYQEQGNMRNSLDYYIQAVELAEEIGAIYELRDAYQGMAEVYTAVSDHVNANICLNQLMNIKDTIFSELSQQQINMLQVQYETEAMARENKLLKRDVELSRAKDKQQKLVMYLFILGFLFTIIIIALLTRSNQLKNKTNIELASKNALITEQQNEISDSIRYARRIQNAMLPPGDYIKDLLPERFIIFRPRNIVSGDFYWLKEKNDKIICTVADCTGHGVPGAFMSMLGIALLNEIVNKYEAVNAGEILNELRDQLVTSLRQSHRSPGVLDGMDMTLMLLDLKNRSMEFAGAMNPLFIIRNGRLIEYKADKMPVGFHSNKDIPFTSHTISIEKGDVLYAFTDGYCDQFGGPSGKKFMIRNFKGILEQIHSKPMEEQKLFLENTIDKWMSEYAQVDDILVMGIRI